MIVSLNRQENNTNSASMSFCILSIVSHKIPSKNGANWKFDTVSTLNIMNV